MPADRAVVRGHLHGGGKELCRPGVGRASEPEQHMRALSRLEQGLGQAEQRRNADPAPHQQRPGARVGLPEPHSERSDEGQTVPRAQGGEALRPRPDLLEQELELNALGERSGARVGEGPGQVRALPLTASPPLGRGEHVELARPGLRRPQAVDGRDQPVGAELARAGDLRHPARGPGPVGVLITRSTSPASIRSTTCGEPSESFLIRSTGTHIRRIACAVPPVASSSKPRSWSEAASWVAAGLSPSVTEMNTVPEAGSSAPAAPWALPKAAGESAAIPMTSPVDLISGPSRASALGKRPKGSTASLTDTCPSVRGSSSSRSESRSPSIRRHATLASGTPTAFEANGTVREARGLASST